MPAIQNSEYAEYVGVSHANCDEWFGEGIKGDQSILLSEKEKAQKFYENYGGRVFGSYQELLDSDEIDAVYLPLPPGLHYKWAKKVLESGKHLFVEKPSTVSSLFTRELIDIAREKNLAIHENYMFVYHTQLDEISKVVQKGVLGDVRLYRIAFGFPKRSATDFRYNKNLGGGALLDCGGYTLKLASNLLGESAKIVAATSNYTDEFEVDIYGSATLVNDDNVAVQIAFGMDNSYKCELEIWGSKGTLHTGRIFTAPVGFESAYTLNINGETNTFKLKSDDTFLKSIDEFCKCVINADERESNYKRVLKQSNLIDEFIKLSS